MSTFDERIQTIKTQLIGNSGARVLLVEGPDDVDAYRIFLDRKFPEWEKNWLLEAAGKKASVVQMAKKEPTWLGLVDRDEWTDDEIAEQVANCPNLLILPRFCLESYLVDPSELWLAFPQKQRDKIAGGEAQFRQELAAHFVAWIRHAALWHGVRPLWRQLRGLGFPDAVLASPPMPDDENLRERFKSWHNSLDADAILSQVHSLQTELALKDQSELCRKWLYAKNFYPEVVHQTLNRLLGQKPAKDRRIAILRTRVVPDDLGVLWDAMGLNPP